MAQPYSNGLGIDDVYLAVNLPQPTLTDAFDQFNGAVVGVASWGPFNTPLTFSTPQDMVGPLGYGPPINTGMDIVQDGALFFAQLPQGGLTCVRVGDGTQSKASGYLLDTGAADGLKMTGIWAGTYGNKIGYEVTQGTNWTPGHPTYMVTLYYGRGGQPHAVEVYDKIPAGTPSTDGSWVNIMNAINGVSQLVVCALPATPSVLEPQLNTRYTMSNFGSNGTSGVTTATLLGQDGGAGTRQGMYALRGTGFDLVWLAGSTDSTAWSTLDTFAISESAAALGCITASDTVAQAISDFIAASVADANFFCGWGSVTYLDTFVQAQVTLPATPVIAGICARMNASDSPGNQPAYGIIGTQLTLSPNPQPLSYSDMTSLEANGILFLAQPIPAGNVIGLRHGQNTSTNTAINSIPYTRKLNQILRDLGGPVIGQYVNKKQTTRDPDPTRQGVFSALVGYFGPQKVANEIDDFSVQCNLANNPIPQIQAGVLTALIVVEFMAVVNRIILNITAGQTVTVANQTNAGS